MSETNPPHTTIRTIEADGLRIRVQLRIAHDGIEYVGRLWFEVEGDDQGEIADRAALPGREIEDVVARARDLSDSDFQQRYQRATGERRRYRALRHATNDILSKIRRLHEITISMKAGLTDADSAAEDILDTERRLHGLIDGLRLVAGIEDDTVERHASSTPKYDGQ